MSYDSSNPFNPKDIFSGGYCDNTVEHTMADKFSPYSRNVRLDWTATTDRPWHSLHSTLTSWDYPRGIWSYLRTVASNDRLVVRHNTDGTHKLYSIETDWTATSVATGSDIASDNRMTFQNVADVIYCMNWVDDFGKLSGTTYTTPSTGITNFSPSFSVVFNGSHWASGWSDNPNLVYKSVGNDYEDFNSSWADSFTFWEQIVWLATNSQALFYFTNNTISVTWVSDIQDIWGSISYTTRSLQTKEWSVNHTSIVSAGNNIYCVTPSNKIIQIARGSNVDWFEIFELSERPYAGISKIMSTLDVDQTNSFGYFLPKENLIKWFFRTKNANYNDICIVYDITKDAFLIDDNKPFYDWVYFKWLNYTVSNIEPKVYLDEYWCDDEDMAIQARYETKYFDLQMPTRKKELWESRAYVAINTLAQLKQEIIVDGGTIDSKTIDSDNVPITTWGIGTNAVGTYAVWTEWFTWEDNLYNVDLIRTKWNLQNKGKRIKFIYTQSALWGRFRLEDLEAMIEILPPEASNLTV